jgi:hypothetical protein
LPGLPTDQQNSISFGGFHRLRDSGNESHEDRSLSEFAAADN